MSAYSELAQIYDTLYGFKNYEAEAKRLREIIEVAKQSRGNTLLDVACGTGLHLVFLKKYFAVEGVDLTPQMLEIARARHPEIKFNLGDMRTFDLGRKFDVVMCLFSSIGYMKTPRRLREAIINMARHLEHGGVLIVEPWLSPDALKLGGVHSLFVDKPELKIARLDIPSVKGRVSIHKWHMLIGTPSGIKYLRQKHELGMFTDAQYREAFAAAGLKVFHDEKGLMNRGLYIGTSAVTATN
jgi:ubiquinone/menaquinone biosynthesis C-methylase UbiE